MQRGGLALLLLALLTGAPATRVLAQGAQAASSEDSARSPFTIQADQVSYEQTRKVYEASGNVRIVQEQTGRKLSADWVTFDPETGRGIAVGNVRIEGGGDVLTAEFATVDLRSLQALATDATLVSDPRGFQIQGGTLERTGSDTYRVRRGRFTACRCANPKARLPWELTAKQADVKVEGYAVARGVVGRVLDIPVFYTPYLVIPIRTKRQTGFLLPRYDTSGSRGASIEVPFFWAAREDTNILLRPQWTSRRGLHNRVDLERVFGEEGSTQLGGALLLNDPQVSERDLSTRLPETRWAFWLRHEQPLAPGFRLGADVRRISDNDYLVDFDDLDGPEAVRSSRFLRSRGWATGARRGLYAGVELGIVDDLQSPEAQDRDRFLLYRLPDIHLSSVPRRLGPLPLQAGFEARYTNFVNQGDDRFLDGIRSVNGIFFDTGPDGLFNADEPDAAGSFPGTDSSRDDSTFEGDGRFQEGELLADSGQRLDLFPRVVLPVRGGPFELLAEGGLRSTLYASKHRGIESRALWTARFDARSRLFREFEVRGVRFRHLVEPRVAFAFITPQSQRTNPLFIPQAAFREERLIDGDLRLLSRNPSDRIGDERLLQVAIANRLLGDARDGAAPRQLAAARLSSGYDFELGRATNVFLNSELTPGAGLSGELDVSYDPKQRRMEELRAVLSWSRARDLLSLRYRFQRDVPLVFERFFFSNSFDRFDNGFRRINQVSGSGRLGVTARLDLFASGIASFEDQTKTGTVGVILHSSCRCWDLIGSVTRRVRPTETLFSLSLRVAGIGFGLGGASPPAAR
ncbi:MAG: LPS-assembly protein LptD [Myxococcota bacterium]